MRITRLFVLLALAALLAPRVEASRTSVWERNPHSSLTETKSDTASALASLAPAAVANVDGAELPRFDLGDIVLVERELELEQRFDLGPLTLVDLNLLRGPPPSYPETRVGGFELLPPFRVGASPRLSLWPRRACGFSCREVVSDSPEDPWGLAVQAEPSALGWLEQQKAASEDLRELKWLLRPSVLKSNWRKTDYLGDVAAKVAGVLTHSIRSAVEAPGTEFAGVGILETPSLVPRALRGGAGVVRAEPGAVRLGEGISGSLGKAAGGASEAAKAERTFITYLFRNEEGRVAYVGRASGAGTPQEVLKARLAKGHHIFESQPGLRAEVIDTQLTRDANLGAEQAWFEFFRDKGEPLLNSPGTPPLSARTPKLPTSERRIRSYVDQDLAKGGSEP